MCGIAGILDRANAPAEREIEAMIADIAYRGPDGSGTVVLPAEGIALGHRRLKILDLTEGGAQPMASADGRYLIVFNGEIYNYLELRSQLAVSGQSFRSRSDTEVLLAAYARWGAECLGRLIGMYAFAIWDRERRELFAARDRLGIKPFYYCASGGALLFASEIKCILAAGRIARRTERALIDAYMEFGYVPGEATLHAGVSRLLPGHALWWRDGRLTLRQYWDLGFDHISDEGMEGAAESVNMLLGESVALHLRSDVPVGVFLSGGLDSSTVVSLLSREALAGLKTFSVAYDFGKEFDETPFARQVAQAFHTDHQEVRMSAQDFVRFIPAFAWHMDEPVADSAAISLYYVSKLARQEVVVCLSGEGSDEIFAGYDFYLYNLAIERLRRLAGEPFLRSLAALTRSSQRMEKLRKYLELAGQPLEERYRGISTSDRRKTQSLYAPEFLRAAAGAETPASAYIRRLFERSRGWDCLSRMLYFDTKTWLVDDLLIKADRMSMASSIELRVPFLDHRLVECAATIPSKYKVRGIQTKCVLREAVRGRLPARILRRRKRGFPTPLKVMFGGELFDYAHDLLLSDRARSRGYFAPERVRALLFDHRAGRASNEREIWRLVVLEEWHRHFGF
ncbi:MAG: asparagine synthase (glutamine-hydrolyzing) [Gammaproteobacteria bacterium]|nr:asparagine synthase (glutamine-hydrolyzing) [Gammaproteobacteria bacterium]